MNNTFSHILHNVMTHGGMCSVEMRPDYNGFVHSVFIPPKSDVPFGSYAIYYCDSTEQIILEHPNNRVVLIKLNDWNAACDCLNISIMVGVK